jgi:hypothetical protein
MSGAIDIGIRARARDRERFKACVTELVGVVAVAARYLDSRVAREFVRTVALMLPALIDSLSKHPNQPTARGLAEIHTAIQTAEPLRAQELREQGRALANDLGLSMFAPMFDDDASGRLELSRIFNAEAIADLVVKFKRTDT